MKEAVATRLQWNLDRVKHLVAVYGQLKQTSGRPTVEQADILRAAVVFLHATLEDFLRGLLEWKLPLAAPGHLIDVPFVGKKSRANITLEDLAHYRGSSVDNVISRSVERHLERSNFNDPGEIDAVLERVGLSKQLLDPHRSELGPMMSRRHWIVHRADRDSRSGSGQQAAVALDVSTVESWINALSSFGNSVLQGL